MKKIFIFLMLVLPSVVLGQFKTVESSAKKAPMWLNGAEKGYIIANAQAPTLEQAKELVMQSVQRQIIEAVALNIKSDFQSRTQQTMGAGENMEAFSESFDNRFATQAARLPFVKGISANKIGDFYWEKQVNKKAGLTQWGYSVKYSFSAGELHKLVSEFTKIDVEMTAKLEAMEALPDNFATTEQLDRALGDVPTLKEWFFDDVRLRRTDAAQGAIRQQYGYITPVLSATKKGEARLILMTGDRVVTTSQKPVIKSNCATEINYVVQGEEVMISYDDEGCMEDEQNYLEVSYRLGGKAVKSKLFFDVSAEKLEVSIVGKLHVRLGAKVDGDSVQGVSVTLTVNNRNGVAASVQGMSLSIPELAGTVVVNGLVENISGAGEHVVTIDSPARVSLQKGKVEGLPMVKGYIYVMNDINGSLVGIPIAHSYLF